MNVVLWRALLSARAAEATSRLRERIAAAEQAVEGEREGLLVEALAAAADAIDELTNLAAGELDATQIDDHLRAARIRNTLGAIEVRR